MNNIDGTYFEEKNLAEGNYGQVKLMHHKEDPQTKFAVKIYAKNQSEEAGIRHFQQEGALKKLHHPNIIKLVEMNESGKLVSPSKEFIDVRYAVLELATNGNFLDYIANNAMDSKIVRYYFKQLCQSVNYMHQEGICHRDLKMENLLLDENFNLKVSDFGFCTEIMNKYGDSLLTICKGTPGYMAPEMININGFNHVMNQKSHKLFASKGYNGIQTDIFALGVILFSLYMGRPPFKIADINDPFYRLILSHQIGEFWEPWDQFAAQNSFEIPEDFKNLFIGCVTFSPLLRVSINEILSNSWMQRDMPTQEEVFDYMSAIKTKIDQLEAQQQAYYSAAQAQMSTKTEEKKEEVLEGENLNDSSLSAGSQILDEEENIMKDLEDIESEFLGNDMDQSNSFNLGEDEFNLDGFSEAEDVDVDHILEDEEEKSKDLPLEQNESSSTACTAPAEDQTSQIIQFLENLTEVDTEVKTSIPEKMISFLEQYGKLKQWKIVKLLNYVLLKIPENSGTLVEFAIKFDQQPDQKYALKYLKYDEMSFEQFHEVGSFILKLISPYC